MQEALSVDFIEKLRSKVDLTEVIGEYVVLRPAGVDSYRGLCPFHEEKSPSFYVRTGVGRYHCFGCGEDGDVYDFIQNIDHIGFKESIEKLAQRYGMAAEFSAQMRSGESRSSYNLKSRILAANKLLAEYFQQQLTNAEASAAQEFLASRNFSADLIARFGCGYAGGQWDQATSYLVAKGFTVKELESAGISRMNSTGKWVDRFRKRLIWPIRSASGEVIGFGARKLFDDDGMAKYLNTPETVVYKKSQVLFGLDQAKKSIVAGRQAVIVEGYTDVMAMHAAGVTTAVASCGTAFGLEHMSLVRRLLLTDSHWGSEVIYTFDGDKAGKAATEKAYLLDKSMLSQSFVSQIKDGLDPCDLRLKYGDEALKNLIAQRIPLIEFILRHKLDTFDTANPAGKRAAIESCIEILSSIPDYLIRKDYAGQYASWLGLDSEDTYSLLRRIKNVSQDHAASKPVASSQGSAVKEGDSRFHSISASWDTDPVLAVQKRVIQAALQYPLLAGDAFDALPTGLFTDPILGAIKQLIVSAGGVRAVVSNKVSHAQWLTSILAASDATQQGKGQAQPDGTHSELALIIQYLAAASFLATENNEIASKFINDIIIRAQEQWVSTQIREMKMALHKISPHEENYVTLFGDLIALESYRKTLIERISGY